MEDLNTIGRRLRQARIANRLRQQDVADALGFTEQYISLIEQGRGTPAPALLLALAHLYEVLPEQLICGLDAAYTDLVTYALKGMQALAEKQRLCKELGCTAVEFENRVMELIKNS